MACFQLSPFLHIKQGGLHGCCLCFRSVQRREVKKGQMKQEAVKGKSQIDISILFIML